MIALKKQTKQVIFHFFREPKSSTAGDEEGEEKNEEDAEDEDSVMTIDGVEGGYAWMN